jgi:hypothetical protein
MNADKSDPAAIAAKIILGAAGTFLAAMFAGAIAFLVNHPS